MKNLIITCAAVLLVNTAVFGQTNKEKAVSLTQEAITLMDNGKIDKSIELLEEALKLDPENFDIEYEMALAHYWKEDYKGAIKILESNKKDPNVSVELFQLLGNAYDMVGKQEKAFDTYDEGLAKFPNAGSLYLEKGNVYWIKEDYGKALGLYEEGIIAAPDFASNYYRATLIYLKGTDEEVWGMIYGEIFMNLERNTKRTAEISKLLYDVYSSEITFSSDTSIGVSFSKMATMSVSDFSDPESFKLPFGMGAYEPTLLMSVIGVKSINLSSLNIIRTGFIENYFNVAQDVKYPNALFSYNRLIKDAGHFEAYNYWLLMQGNPQEFDSWKSSNKEKWDAFIEWFNANPLVLDANNKFSRFQY